MRTQLRDYQKNAIKEIRTHFATSQGESHVGDFCYEARRRVILQMATGSGKTATFAEMLKLCHQKKSPAIMVVRGAKLVHQASERLTREGVPHGIYQAGNTRDTHHDIHICSIDTLYARQIAPTAEFIVIDECHLTTGKSYQWLTTHENYRESFFLGVSATPFSKTGLRHIGSKVIYPVTFAELMEKKFLVGAKYRVPHRPNLKGVKKIAGEFSLKDLEKRLREDDEQTALYGSLKKEWAEQCKGKKAILFGVSVQHAKDLGAQLREVGARTAHIDGNTPHLERDRIISELEQGKIDVITSVGVLTTGVDIPPLTHLIVCRPTQSYNLWIQMLGRGTRPYEAKTHFTVIDLADNTKKHGPIEAEMRGDVDPWGSKREASNMTSCDRCYAAYPMTSRLKYAQCDWFWCPSCFAKTARIVRDKDGKEIDVKENAKMIERDVEPWELDYPSVVEHAREKGYKKGYIVHWIRGKYGEEAAQKAFYRVRALKNWGKKKGVVVDQAKEKSEIDTARAEFAKLAPKNRLELKEKNTSLYKFLLKQDRKWLDKELPSARRHKWTMDLAMEKMKEFDELEKFSRTYNGAYEYLKRNMSPEQWREFKIKHFPESERTPMNTDRAIEQWRAGKFKSIRHFRENHSNAYKYLLANDKVTLDKLKDEVAQWDRRRNTRDSSKRF